MQYLSTRNNKLKESFLNILFQGLSKEGGLFMPSSWPSINIKNLRGKNYQEIAHDVISPFVKDDISDDRREINDRRQNERRADQDRRL